LAFNQLHVTLSLAIRLWVGAVSIGSGFTAQPVKKMAISG